MIVCNGEARSNHNTARLELTTCSRQLAIVYRLREILDGQHKTILTGWKASFRLGHEPRDKDSMSGVSSNIYQYN